MKSHKVSYLLLYNLLQSFQNFSVIVITGISESFNQKSQAPRVDVEDVGEEGCLVLDPEWKEDAYKGVETLVRDLNNGYGALSGFGDRVWWAVVGGRN